MDTEVASCKQFFKSHCITLSDEWLESCIEWYHEENPGRNYTPATLHQKVYEQWLLLDLREVEVPILPPNLRDTQKIVLNRTFPLQLMYLVDISQPKLSQLQKIRNMVLNSTEDEYQPSNTSSKRVLQLTLTDGVQEVEAIEYKTIAFLDINLTPGCKLKIIGPVTVRRGQLMLESKNVEILGGEVEELLVSNAYENILAKDLKLPLNPQPINIKVEPTNPGVNSVRPVENTYNNRNTENQYIDLSNSSRPQNRNKLLQSSIASYVHTSNIKINNSPSNPIIINQPNMSTNKVASLHQIRNYENHEIQEVEKYMKEEQMIIDECDNLLEIEKDFEMEERLLKQNNSKNSNLENRVNYFEDERDVDVFDGIDIDSHLNAIDQQIAQNFKITLINDLISNKIANGKFRIKAKFKKVSSKLSFNETQQWSLRIIIEDSTGEIESWVHTDVITKIIDCTPAAVLALKADIHNKNPDSSNFMIQKIHILRSKIEHLDCVMELTFKSSEQYPTLTNLE